MKKMEPPNNIVLFPQYTMYHQPAGNLMPVQPVEMFLPPSDEKMPIKDNGQEQLQEQLQQQLLRPKDQDDSKSYWKGMLAGVSVFTIFEIGRVLLFGF